MLVGWILHSLVNHKLEGPLMTTSLILGSDTVMHPIISQGLIQRWRVPRHTPLPKIAKQYTTVEYVVSSVFGLRSQQKQSQMYFSNFLGSMPIPP